MPYTINRTNGTLISTLQDGTVDKTSLGITLVGKNFTGYGDVINENFVQMLENFANVTPPLNPMFGQLFYNTALKTLRVYTGVGIDPWKSVGIIENSITIPTGNSPGNLWWKTDEGRLYGYTGNGNNWTLIGPQTSNTPYSGPKVSSILRATTGSDIIVKMLVNGAETSIFSDIDNTFNDGTSPADQSFDTFPIVKQGITFPTYAGYQPGVSYWDYPNGGGGYILWGTASSALGMVSQETGELRLADEYLKFADLKSFPPINITNNSGVTIGSPSIIKVHVTDSNIGNVSNIYGTPIRFNIGTTNSTSTSSSSFYNVFSITTGTQNDPKILPNSSASVYIGTPSQQFSYLYVNTGTFTTVNATTVNATTVNATTVNDNNSRVITSFSVNVGRGLDLGNSQSQTIFGPNGSFTLVNTGTLTVTGTLNQINVTSGQYPVLSLPQNIDTSAIVTFQRVNGGSLFDNNSRVITQATIGSNGVSYLSGTTNQINVNANIGSVTLSLPQNIDTSAIVTFQRVNGGSLFDNNSRVITQATIGSNGVSHLSGTTNQINVNANIGSVTLSLPQNIDTSANVTFQRVNGGSLFDNNSRVITQATIGSYGVSGLTSGGHITISGSTGSLTLGSDATSDNSPNTIVARDGQGSFHGFKIHGEYLVTTVLGSSVIDNDASASGYILGQWKLINGSTFQATYADLAERYAADAIYEPGTVLIIGGDQEVTVTQIRADVARAGIVSTNPAYTLNEEAGNDQTHPYIALVGRVPCKVYGIIKKGQLLVTSSISGFAEPFQNGDNPTAVIARALESFDGGFGTIQVMVV